MKIEDKTTMTKIRVGAGLSYLLFLMWILNCQDLKKNNTSMDIIIREAQRHDCVHIRQLIQELADFENMSDSPKIDAKTLERDGFDTENPHFKCLVVEDKKSSGLIGYAIFNVGYTVGQGKSIYLEDIMVTEKDRGKGVGNLLLKRVIQDAAKMNCVVINFVVLEWNPAVKFYINFGAEDLTKTKDCHYFAMQKDKINEIAAKYQ